MLIFYQLLEMLRSGRLCANLCFLIFLCVRLIGHSYEVQDAFGAGPILRREGGDSGMCKLSK